MSTLSPIMARLAALKETHNLSAASEASNTTPLETYVRLYNKAKGSEQGGGSCYTDYMEGGKLLYKFLSPIEIDHTLVFKSSPTPHMLVNYESQQVTKILCGELGMQNPSFGYIQNLVTYYTAKHILEDMTV